MNVDTVDRTIRNQRPPTFVRWLPLIAFAIAWIAALFVIDIFFPQLQHPPLLLAVMVVQAIVFPLLMPSSGSGPVSRMKLGEQLIVNRNHRINIEKIREIQFDDDPLEDFAEARMPFPVCQITVSTNRKSKLHLIASRGEAIRVREWAESHSIRVVDPQGLSKG